MVEETRPYTQRETSLSKREHRHCVETSFEHLLPRASGRDPCHRENDRGVVVAHGVVIPTGRVSSPEESVDCRQKTENKKEALDDVILGLSVGVIASESTLARAEREGLPAKILQGGRCIGRRAQDNQGFLLLVS